MSEPIGDLRAKIGLDASGLSTDEQKVVGTFRAMGSRITSSWQQATASVREFAAGASGRLAAARGQITELAGAFGPGAGRLAGLMLTPQALGIGVLGAAVLGYRRLATESERIVSNADKLNLSTTAFERLEHIAMRTGTSFGTVASGIQKMGVNLTKAGSDPALRTVLQSFNLDANKLIRMRPEDAFVRIAKAVASVENPMQRARMEMELFGRSGVEMDAVLRQVAQQFDKVPVVSELSRKALAVQKNFWLDAAQHARKYAGEVGGALTIGAMAWKKLVPDVIFFGQFDIKRTAYAIQDELNARAKLAAQREADIEASQADIERKQSLNVLLADYRKKATDAGKSDRELALAKADALKADDLQIAALKRNLDLLDRIAARKEGRAIWERASDDVHALTRELEYLRAGLTEAESAWKKIEDRAIEAAKLRGWDVGEMLAKQKDTRKKFLAEFEERDLLQRGKTMRESLRSPLDTFVDKLNDIEKLLGVGALGVGEAGIRNAARAIVEAREVFAGAAGPGAPLMGAVERYSQEAYSATVQATMPDPKVALLQQIDNGIDRLPREIAEAVARELGWKRADFEVANLPPEGP